jgi:hypothetical protein
MTPIDHTSCLEIFGFESFSFKISGARYSRVPFMPIKEVLLESLGTVVFARPKSDRCK